MFVHENRSSNCDIDDVMALILIISFVFARPTNRRTDTVDYTDARTHLKRERKKERKNKKERMRKKERI